MNFPEKSNWSIFIKTSISLFVLIFICQSRPWLVNDSHLIKASLSQSSSREFKAITSFAFWHVTYSFFLSFSRALLFAFLFLAFIFLRQSQVVEGSLNLFLSSVVSSTFLDTEMNTKAMRSNKYRCCHLHKALNIIPFIYCTFSHFLSTHFPLYICFYFPFRHRISYSASTYLFLLLFINVFLSLYFYFLPSSYQLLLFVVSFPPLRLAPFSSLTVALVFLSFGFRLSLPFWAALSFNT